MNTLDRGGMWSGYYRRDSVDVVDQVFGIKWLNHYDCGTYVDADGVRQGITFLIIYRGDTDFDFGDCKAEFAEQFDLSAGDADFFCADPLRQAVAAGVQVTPDLVESVSWACPSVKEIVLHDLTEGLTGMEIFDKHAGVLNYRFLGFSFDEMVDVHPEIVQSTIDSETGVEAMHLIKCSLEEST